MKKMKRILSMLLVCCMLLNFLPAMAFASTDENAAEPSSLIEGTLNSVSATHINPEYQHLNIELPPSEGHAGTTDTETVTVDSLEAAGDYLREQMEERSTSVTVIVRNYNFVSREQTSADRSAVLDMAFEHTGVPTQGDYIHHNYYRCTCSWSINGTDLTLSYYDIVYMASAKQEDEVDAAVDALLSDWEDEGIQSKSDYEKIYTIYDYICDNVEYDHENLGDESYLLKHSTYAAMVQGVAVCQGYATLFYRLALELGVDARYVSGIGNSGAHGWNIAKLGNKYYLLDSTWDAGKDVYAYFLCGSDNFPDHTLDSEYLTAEFTAQYPISREDYDIPDGVIVLSGTCGENIEWTLSVTGVLKLSGTGAMTMYYSTSDLPWDGNRGSITSLVVSEGITSLSHLMCYYSARLKTVTLPVSLTSIGQKAFMGCAALATVYYGGSEAQWDSVSVSSDNFPLTNAEFVFNYAGNELAAPVVTVTLNSSDKPVLTWDAVDGAEQYEIWRAVGNGEFTLLKTMTGRKLTHTSAEAGKTYSYKVRAVAGDTYSEYSDTVSITVPCALAAPANVTVTLNDKNQPVITWSAVDGAEKYEVWRAVEGGQYSRLWIGTGKKVTNTSAEEGKTYSYKVRAVAGDTCSEYSAVKTITVPSPVALEAPTLSVSNKVSTGKVVLKWNTIVGAEKYEIWFSTSKSGTYKKLWTGSGTQVNHNSGTAGVTYYYKVRAMADGVYSEFSAAKSRTCDLAQPVITLSNNASTGKVVISWNAVSGAAKYEVYRATSKNGTYVKLWTGISTKLNNTSTEPGDTYYYKVRAICGATSNGNSAYSEIKSRTCDCARPSVTIALNSKGQPVLTWGKVAGAVKYEVYRSTSPDSGFTKLWTGTGTKLTNTSAKEGNTYYYKVKAIASVSTGNSAYSEVKSISLVSSNVYGVVLALKWIEDSNGGYALAHLSLMDGTVQKNVKLTHINGIPFEGVEGKTGVDFLNGKVSSTMQYNDADNYLCRVIANADGSYQLETDGIQSYTAVTVRRGVPKASDSNGTAIFYSSNTTQFLIYDSAWGYFVVTGIDALTQDYENVNVCAVLDVSGIAEYVYLFNA